MQRWTTMAAGFRLGPWLVEPQRNTISRDNEEKHLENRLMQTLLFLSEHAGQVLTRENFFESVWQGRVVNEEALSRAISLLRTALEDNARDPQYIQTIPGVGYRLIGTVKADGAAEPVLPRQESAAEPSIAVLPFVNLSENAGNEYFSDGISEEIINALVQLPDLKVVGRTSSFAFKGVNQDLRLVGRSLDVSHVLEGSVRIAGDQIRVTAQLIKTDDGYHLWSKTFSGELGDIFSVQDDISQAVADELEHRLLHPLTRARETSPEAYSLYLQALHLLRSGEIGKMRKALELFQEVIELDRDYAPAWVGLADTYWYLTSYGELKRADCIGLATQACDRALQLDERLAEAHNCKANLYTAFHRNWGEVKRAMERALELAPGNSRAALQAGNLANTLGDFEQAVILLRKAVSLDPLNLTGHIWLALAYNALDRLDDAEAIIRQALRVNDQRVVLNSLLSRVMLRQGHTEAAYEQCLREPEGFWRDYSLNVVLLALDRRAEADRELARLTDTYGDEAPMQLAEIHCLRENTDDAFGWLERAYELRDNGLQHLLASTYLRPLHGDPRWHAFIRKMGLV